MTGPVAAARPLLLRPGPTTLLLKQLSGPATSSSSTSSLLRRPATSFSTLGASQGHNQHQHYHHLLLLSTCLAPRIHQQVRRVRLYSTNPPKPGSEDPSRPHEEESTTPTTESSSSSSSSSSSPSPPPPPPPSPAEAEEPSSPSQPRPQEQEQEQQPRQQQQEQQQEQPPPPPPNHPDEPELPSQADSRRSALSQNVSRFMDNLQSRVLVASQALNDLTGYSAIERIKQTNARLEADLAAAQAALRRARARYQEVNARRAATQREVTTLLARKDTWAPADLERFTALYRTDHELEAAVHQAAAALTDAEADEARLGQALNSGILKRYHEEQIWSDRIRRQSTWGTWGLMGVNFLMFLVLQFVAEPWRRRRLMRGIAAEEKAALDAVRRELEEVRGALAGLDRDRMDRDRAGAGAGAEAEADIAAADVAAATDAAAAAAADATEPSVPVAVAEEAGVEAAAPFAAPEFPPVAMVEAETEAGAGDASAPTPAPPPQVSWREFLSDPSRWRPVVEDLYSDRRIALRMRDVSLIALEGAVTGAAVVASIALLLARRS